MVSLNPTVMLLHLLLILVYIYIYIFPAASSHSTIDKLPGYPHTLPFKLETGYIGVGEEDEIQLFYYFIESENDPRNDPLLLWFTGGPGCTGLSSLVYVIGPMTFDYKESDEIVPSLVRNPHSWTQIASIIFIDSPVGTGFSFSTTSDGYASSDTKAARDNYTFLRKWLLEHPMFAYNRLYIGGDSHGGKMAPMVALEIAKGNEAGIWPPLFLQCVNHASREIGKQGYIIGNPVAYENKDHNEQVPYAHRMALLSDEYYELAKSSCQGEYVNPDPSNIRCLDALKLYKECTDHVNLLHILKPQCVLHEEPLLSLLTLSKEVPFCRVIRYTYLSSRVWANNETIQDALHVRKGTVTNWIRCHYNIPYDSDVESVYEHHHLLNEKGFRALVYSGDHDLGIPYMGTLKWIRNLNLTLDEKWRPWSVDDQVAGYTEKYKKKDGQGQITFATVKGAGHTAPEDKRKECLEMVTRWLNKYPL